MRKGQFMLLFNGEEHKAFYYSKLTEFESLHSKKADVYTDSLIYTLSILDGTRKHFDVVYDLEKDEIQLLALNCGWQTSSSLTKSREVSFLLAFLAHAVRA